MNMITGKMSQGSTSSANHTSSMNIAGDKMFSHLGRVAGDRRPITADIFLTNYCNNRCPYCTYGRWELDEGAYAMSLDDFIIYANRLRELGVLGFILTGGGEPTVSPYFDGITKWLEDNKLHYGINSNFNIFKRCRPDYLKVSLDGWDEDSYEASRGIRAYAKVRENIKEYAAWKRDESPSTTLGIQRVVEKVEDVLRFYDANADLPVDYMVFRPMESTGGHYYATSDKKELAGKIVNTIRKLSDQDSRVSLNFKWNMLEEKESTCVANWAQIAVNEHGQVMYCCHKPYEIVGHVLDPDILERKMIGTNMSMCDVPCRMTAPNKMVALMLRHRKDAWFI